MFKLFSGALLAVAIGFASPAAAATIVATQSGVITQGWDSTGVFGSNPDLAGRSYEIVATFDSAVGVESYVDAFGSTLYGPGFGNGVLKVDGVSITLGSLSNSHVDATKTNSPVPHTYIRQDLIELATGPDGLYTSQLLAMEAKYSPLALISTDVLNPPIGNLCLLAYYCGGNFALYQGIDSVASYYAIGTLSATNYTITVSGVPEPGVWALLIVGFLALGQGLRQRSAYYPVDISR